MKLPPRTDRALPHEPGWPAAAPSHGPLVALVDASSRFEDDLLSGWIERHRPDGRHVETIRIASSRRRRPRRKTDQKLAARLGSADNPWFLPLRVAWLPFERNGRRIVRFVDIIKLGDPRDPDAVRQRAIAGGFPHRVRPVVGAGADALSLMAAHTDSDAALDLGTFVTRRAWRALDRAERALRGNRYKVPKFINETIASRPEFGAGAVRHGAERGLSAPVALARARHYLKEVAASHSPFLIDLIAGGIHWLYSQGYGSIRYDRRRLTEISALGQEYPLVFLPSHRSNLDRLSLQFILWENDLPPNHTAGAINMNFFPVGALVRRTGVFFIRRSFKDNPLYKFVLRTYIDHLIENRFSLEWYLEGGRSRSGRLLPPRFGLLAYVVESLKRGKAEDVMLIPVSIAYDQIQDLSTYTHEVKGGKKEQETFSWFLSAVRSLRRRYGNIHIRFGEPVSVASELKHIDTAEEGSRDLAKLAFEIMYRISRITPITPASVVCIALLQGDEEANTLAELADFCGQLDTFITDHEFPTTEPLALEEPVAVAKVLKLLTGQGIVSSDSNPLRVFWLDAEQRLAASYYRNVVVHFFVPRGIAELAILAAGDAKDPPAAFWAEVSRLRGLLESEFYFADKARFRNEMELDLASVATDWEGRLARPGQLIDQMRPRVADWAVRPFLKG